MWNLKLSWKKVTLKSSLYYACNNLNYYGYWSSPALCSHKFSRVIFLFSRLLKTKNKINSCRKNIDFYSKQKSLNFLSQHVTGYFIPYLVFKFVILLLKLNLFVKMSKKWNCVTTPTTIKARSKQQQFFPQK